MARLLVTGSSSFIGRSVSNELRNQGHEVHLVCRPGSNTDFVTSEVVHLISDAIDLWSTTLDVQPDLIIHLAALTGPEDDPVCIRRMIECNIVWPSLLLQAMHTYGGCMFLNTSSFWMFGENKTNYSPVNLYALHKTQLEMQLDHFASIDGLAAASVCLFDTYGVGDTRGKLLTLLEESFRTGRSLDLTDGRQRINLVNIDDVARGYATAVEMLLQKQIQGHKKYKLDSDECYTVKEVAGLFAENFGTRPTLNWGRIPYGKSTIMNPVVPYPRLPGWKANTNIAKWLRERADSGTGFPQG